MTEGGHDQPVSLPQPVETRTPNRLERFKRWFGALRLVCKEEPRLVLRALANPDKLIGAGDEPTKRIEDLSWELSGREKARKQFVEAGIEDPQKALAVVEFLRGNVGSSNQEARYQYKAYQLENVRRLMEIGDDPVSLLTDLGELLDYQKINLNHLGLYSFAVYAESCGSNPRVREVIALIKTKFPDHVKINPSYGMRVGENEYGGENIHFEKKAWLVKEAVKNLSEMSPEEYQSLVTDDNIEKAKEIWNEFGDGGPLRLEFLADLLKLAEKPEMMDAVRAMLKWRHKENYLGDFPEIFNEAVSRLVELDRAVPKIWDLDREGFDTSSFFNLYENIDELKKSYGQAIEQVLGDERLKVNARILKKHQLRMPIKKQWGEASNFVRKSDPERLEKALLVYDLAHTHLRIYSRSYRSDSNDEIYEMWVALGDRLANFRVDEVRDSFAALAGEDVDEDLVVDLVGLMGGVGTLDELKNRISTAIRPEVALIAKDKDFIAMISEHSSPNYQEFWEELLDDPESYLRVYQIREQLQQNLEVLKRFYSTKIPGKPIVVLEEFASLSQKDCSKLCAEFDELGLAITRETIGKFKILSKIPLEQQQRLVLGLVATGVMGYERSLYNDVLSVEGLQKYGELSETEQEEVIQLMIKMKTDYGFGLVKAGGSRQKVALEFACDLVKSPALKDRLLTYGSQWKSTFAHGGDSQSTGRAVITIYHDLLAAHQGEPDFNIDSYVNSDGVATSALLEAVVSGKTPSIPAVEDLITKKFLSRVDGKKGEFWLYWKNETLCVKSVLSQHLEEVDTLVIRGEGTPKLFSLVAKEEPEFFAEGEDLFELRFKSEDRREIKVNFIEGLTQKNLQDGCVDMVCLLLDQDLHDNGTFDERLKQVFQKAYGCELSEDLIIMLERFRYQSNDPKFDALIPDRQAYWKANTELVIRMKQVGWEIPSFDRFRSVAQNPESQRILSSVPAETLKGLSASVGLNLNNIYYVDKEAVEWLQLGHDQPELQQFFRRILNGKPTSMKSCVTTFRALSEQEQARVMTEPLAKERLFQAMDEFKNITPMLIKGYVLEPDGSRRQEFKNKVQQFREQVHQNIPILGIAEDETSRKLLYEMIGLTFPGTNPTQIAEEITQVGDRCEDIANLKIRTGGYQGKILSREKVAELRDADKTIDERVVNLVKQIFASDQDPDYVEKGGDDVFAYRGWVKLLTEAGATEQGVLFQAFLTETIACARVSLGEKIELFKERMSGDTSQVGSKNNLLSKARELFGIYYKDNAAEAIGKYLSDRPDLNEKLLAIFERKKALIEKNLAHSKSLSEESRQEFVEIMQILNSPEPGLDKQAGLARLLAFMTERSMFAGKGLRKMVGNELQKIVLKDKEGQELDPNLILTGYVTKNAASYFAKTTANVCTNHDVELYQRPDHFHLNLVNREGIVVGNIQAYQTVFDGQPALIFRGFNPSTSILSSTNVEVLCDQMVDMVQQVAEDNKILQVLIPQQDSWHPLTNRVGEGVDRYFADRYYIPENIVDFPFAISGTKTVDTFYRISKQVAEAK